MAAEKKPIIKGILKTSSSFDKAGENDPNPSHRRASASGRLDGANRKEMTWDEMNILATYHPPNKDYGHKKIDEPPTPYAQLVEEEDGEEAEMSSEALSEEDILSRLSKDTAPRILQEKEESSESSEEEEETPEERAKRKQFESKRKIHYNEYMAVKLARQLMEEEDEDDEEEEEKKNGEASDSIDNKLVSSSDGQ